LIHLPPSERLAPSVGQQPRARRLDDGRQQGGDLHAAGAQAQPQDPAARGERRAGRPDEVAEAVGDQPPAGEAPDRLQDVRVRADDGARAQRRLRERALAGVLARRALEGAADR